jgi:hypothetical protein
VFIADNLNTHQSESLVKDVAQACGIKDDLGEKEKEGVLKSQVSFQPSNIFDDKTRRTDDINCSRAFRKQGTRQRCSY